MKELSLNILDIVQNSVTANASLIEIALTVDLASDLITVTIKDNGKGMTSGQVAAVTDPFYTTRTTRKVGLGVPFFKMAAEMAGGKFSITSQPERGCEIFTSFQISHIDRMPLGDMCSTVSTLIRMNPDIDFIYSESVSGEPAANFEIDTRRIKEVLDGVPIDSPEIMEWIEGNLSEGMEEIRKITGSI